MTDAERWHAARSPIELHAEPRQIVLEGSHTTMTGEWGRRFCLHLFPDASALDCTSGPLHCRDAVLMVMCARFHRNEAYIAAVQWCVLVERLDEIGIEVPAPACAAEHGGRVPAQEKTTAARNH